MSQDDLEDCVDEQRAEIERLEARLFTAEGYGIAAMPAPEKSPLQLLNEAQQSLRIETSQLVAEQKSNALLRERLKKIDENPFGYVLNLLDAGGTVADLGEKITTLAALVRQRGSKGSLTLKIDVSLMKDTAATLLFAPAVKLNEPKMDAPATILYADGKGALSRKDPNQKEMQFD